MTASSRTPDEILVTGNGNSAFRRTDLESRLRPRGINRVNVMGLATQFSVEHTVRDAADIGYRVRLLRGLLRLRRHGSASCVAAHAGMLAEIATGDTVFQT